MTQHEPAAAQIQAAVCQFTRGRRHAAVRVDREHDVPPARERPGKIVVTRVVRNHDISLRARPGERVLDVVVAARRAESRICTARGMVAVEKDDQRQPAAVAGRHVDARPEIDRNWRDIGIKDSRNVVFE
jgi:hypothetical protein